MDQTEEELILNCQKGDAQSFGKLYDSYHEKVYKFIYFRTYHKQTAEDLTSQVFFKALDKISKYNPKKGKFQSWIFQIAKNCVIDHFRSYKETQDIESVWDFASPSDPQKDAENSINMEKLSRHLSGLNKQQREILILRLWDGFSYKEIAEITNLGESNCKMTVARALAKLQKEMPIYLFLLLIFGFK